jgi:hypothetical protein
MPLNRTREAESRKLRAGPDAIEGGPQGALATCLGERGRGVCEALACGSRSRAHLGCQAQL